MFTPRQLTQGMEWVWVVWLVGVVLVVKMAWTALRRWRRPHWGELARDEAGVSYSLSYVMVFPVFLLFVCLVVETTGLILAKIGTLYAAHAGARSAMVWSSAQPASLRNQRIDQSVWTAMTPFVTGDPNQLPPPPEANAQADQYVLAYNAYASAAKDPNANAPDMTLKGRYLFAASRTTWGPPVEQLLWEDNVTFTVTYLAPLHIPGAARLLDPDGKPPYVYPISSTVTLPNEAPTSADRTLGIDYQSR
jgi:Flp pilus assembly protein TadG